VWLAARRCGRMRHRSGRQVRLYRRGNEDVRARQRGCRHAPFAVVMATLAPSIDRGGAAWHAERVMHGSEVTFSCESSSIGMAALALEALLR